MKLPEPRQSYLKGTPKRQMCFSENNLGPQKERIRFDNTK